MNTNKWLTHRIEENGNLYITADYLWHQFIPSFNFEYDVDGLLALALERGFVEPSDKRSKDGLRMYIVNGEY